MLGLERGEGERAVAVDDGRDAVLEGGPGLSIPEQLGVEMGMGIDEARRDDAACGVDLEAAPHPRRVRPRG